MLTEFENYFDRLAELTQEYDTCIAEFVECNNDNRLDNEIISIMRTIKREFPDIKILGGASIGMVVKSNNYPHLVVKYLHGEVGLRYFSEGTGIPIDASLGYANYGSEQYIPTPYKNAHKILQQLTQEEKEYLVESFGMNQDGYLIINEVIPDLEQAIKIEYDKSNMRYNFSREHMEKLILQYTSLVKKGFFLTDLHMENLTYKTSTGNLKLVDLDCLCYVEELKELSPDRTDFHRILVEIYGFMRHRELKDEFYDFVYSQFNSSYSDNKIDDHH